MESLEIEHKHKIIDLEKKKGEEIAAIVDDYRKKTEKYLEKRNDELREFTSEVLNRLPNVTAAFNMNQGKTKA